jgi:hypothetical protein
MARSHQRMLRDWLRQAKQSRGFIQRNLFRPEPRQAHA